MDINMTERRKKAGRIQMNIIYGKEEEKRGRQWDGKEQRKGGNKEEKSSEGRKKKQRKGREKRGEEVRDEGERWRNVGRRKERK